MSELPIEPSNAPAGDAYPGGLSLCGDCLTLMPGIRSGSVDLIVCDLPYGRTKNKWDKVIDMDRMWAEYKRVLKPSGVVVLFGDNKFSARLMLSNEKMHRYNLVWDKTVVSQHLNAKKMPLRSHEDILVFYRKLPTYNPQKTTGHPRKVASAVHKRGNAKTSCYGDYGFTGYDSTERYPTSVWRFATDRQKSAIHPTQKPVALIEQLVRTYSRPGETVLDNCAGSGTLAIAAINAGRRFILMENDPEMFGLSAQRIKAHYQSLAGQEGIPPAEPHLGVPGHAPSTNLSPNISPNKLTTTP